MQASNIPTFIALSLGFLSLVPDGRSFGAASADGPLLVRTQVDRPVLVREGGEQTIVIQIDIEGVGGEEMERGPVNVAVVLDRSGSMSGRKLEQAKQAAHLLVDQLDRNDVFSLVMYDTDVEVLVPASRLGDRRREIQRRISRIHSGGSTALYDGVKTGGTQLREFLHQERINRVLLLSDGIANVGPSSNREIARLGQKLAGEDISVTTIGLGDDYNEDLMTALAEASDANYYYVADVEELPEVFRRELGELKAVVARDIEIRIRCPKGVKPRRILGRPESIEAGVTEIEFKTLAGEQSRTLFLECLVAPDATGSISEIAEVSVSFTDPSNSGDRNEIGRKVTVEYTGDNAVAESKINREVSADAAIYANAAETDKAIALSDSGQVAACRAQLEAQCVSLRQVLAEAPEEKREALERELRSVEQVRDNLQEDGFSKGQRKMLQNRAYQLKNSK